MAPSHISRKLAALSSVAISLEADYWRLQRPWAGGVHSGVPGRLRRGPGCRSACRALSGEEAVRYYRSLWLYLAAIWSLAATGADANASKTAVGLLAEATKASIGTTWLRETDAGAVSTVEEDADGSPASEQSPEGWRTVPRRRLSTPPLSVCGRHHGDRAWEERAGPHRTRALA